MEIAAFAAAFVVRSRPTDTDSGARIERALVYELGNIGDVVLLMPFLAALRDRFPDCITTMVAKPVAREILANTGLAHDFIELDFDPWARSPVAYEWGRARQLVDETRRRDADVAFTCRHHIRERMVVALSRARRTVGYSLGTKRADRLLTHAVPLDDPNRHKTDDWMGLLTPFGGTTHKVSPAPLRVSAEERDRVAAVLAHRGVASSDTVVAVHPGASVPDKRWPAERFAEVAGELALRPGVRVLWFVDPGGYGSDVVLPPAVVVVRESLRTVIALLERCALFVGNDSGPMHLAAAVGAPTVAIFKRDALRWFAPHGTGHVALTAHDDELKTITVARVLQVVEEAVGRFRPPRPRSGNTARPAEPN